MRFFRTAKKYIYRIARQSPASQNISRLQFIDINATPEAIKRNPDLVPHWIKIIEGLVYSPPSSELIKDYFTRVAQCAFVERESDIRYGGMYYWYSKQKDLTITLIHTAYLGWRVPRRYKQSGWFYMMITCMPSDMRFDALPQFIVVPAQQYNIT